MAEIKGTDQEQYLVCINVFVCQCNIDKKENLIFNKNIPITKECQDSIHERILVVGKCCVEKKYPIRNTVRRD